MPLDRAADQVRARWNGEEDGYTTLRLRRRGSWTLAAGAHGPTVQAGGADAVLLRPQAAPVVKALAQDLPLPAADAALAHHDPTLTPKARRRIVMGTVARLLRAELLEVELPEAPRLFGGRFERVTLLGTGNMGVVWACRDHLNEARPVAVKHAWNLTGPFAHREAYLEHEATVLAACRSDVIAEHVSTFRHDERLHVARELVDGTPLEALAEARTLDAGQRWDVIHDVGRALIGVREAGYLCLDAKTANHIRTAAGTTRMVDLGLARRVDASGVVRIRGRVGNAAFTAPEMGRTRQLDERAMVFALGRIMAHLVTGQQARPHATEAGHASEALAIRARMERTGATSGEQDLVTRACAVDLAQRPTTIEEALAHLGRRPVGKT